MSNDQSNVEQTVAADETPEPMARPRSERTYYLFAFAFPVVAAITLRIILGGVGSSPDDADLDALRARSDAASKAVDEALKRAGESNDRAMQHIDAAIQLSDRIAQRLGATTQATTRTIADAGDPTGRLEPLLASLEARMSRMELAPTASAAQQLALARIQFDAEASRRDAAAAQERAARDVDRVYDLMKWFVGLMATLVLGLFGFVASTILKSSAAGKEGSTKKN